MENQIELTIEGFENWLNSFEEKEYQYAGMPKRSSCCPLAKYLQATTNDKNWYVDSNSYCYNQVAYDLPKWARKFVESVDYCDDAYLTIEEAQVILANIKDSLK